MISNRHKNASLLVNTAALIIIIAGFFIAKTVISMMLMALFISIICAHPIQWLKKRKFPQWLALTIVFIVIALGFILLGGIIGRTISSFSNDLPAYEKTLREIGASIIYFFNEKGIDLSETELTNMLNYSNIMNMTVSLLSNLGEVMGNVVIIFFIAVFLLLEMDQFSLKFIAIQQGTGETLNYLIKIGENIRHYLSIMTIVSLITALLVWGVLAILGVKYAILWALIAFLLNFIPNIGSIVAAIPAVFFALIQSGIDTALWTVAAYLVINMIVGNVVAPKMLGHGMGLSTFIAFISFIFWGYILGTVGMFLSVPLTMAIKIILDQDEKTKWIAVLLGTAEEAKVYDEVHNKNKT